VRWRFSEAADNSIDATATAKGPVPVKARLPKRAAFFKDEGGFTLIELIVVMVIIGILVAMAISTVNIRERAHRAVARANLVTAVPTVEAYYVDHKAYTGMTWAELHAINAGVSPTLQLETVAAQSYCISDSHGGITFHKEGPGGVVEEDGCP
jgi:type IV pilus assembly protein PilA